jgi:hypothetical protein
MTRWCDCITLLLAVAQGHRRPLSAKDGPDHTVSLSDDIKNIQWLEIFPSFAAANSAEDPHLYLEFAPRIALALRELVGERLIDVLPVPQERFFPEAVAIGTCLGSR